MTTDEIVREFIRRYAYGLSARLDDLWLAAVAWEQGNPKPVTTPHPDETDPYPPHR